MKTRESAPNGAPQIITAKCDRHHRTAPVRLSVSLKRLLISQFTPDTLRTLAELMEAESPGMIARCDLSKASLEELAQMLTAGRKPTYGWWCRHTEAAA